MELCVWTVSKPFWVGHITKIAVALKPEQGGNCEVLIRDRHLFEPRCLLLSKHGIALQILRKDIVSTTMPTPLAFMYCSVRYEYTCGKTMIEKKNYFINRFSSVCIYYSTNLYHLHPFLQPLHFSVVLKSALASCKIIVQNCKCWKLTRLRGTAWDDFVVHSKHIHEETFIRPLYSLFGQKT